MIAVLKGDQRAVEPASTSLLGRVLLLFAYINSYRIISKSYADCYE